MATATTTTRKLVLRMSVSLDGFLAGLNGEVHWIFRTSGSDDSTEWVLKTLRDAGVHAKANRCIQTAKSATFDAIEHYSIRAHTDSR